QRDDVRAWPSTTGVDRRNRHENNQPTTDVARHAPVSAGAAHGPSRTAFHQRAHGPRRALGGGDERHLSCWAGGHLDGGETAVSGKGDGILDRAVWHLCELADHDARRSFRYGSEVSNFSSRL